MNPILSPITISSPTSGPRVLVIGGVHGDEFEPIAALRKLTVGLRGRITRGTVTLIPIANPSAYERGQRRRADPGT